MSEAATKLALLDRLLASQSWPESRVARLREAFRHEAHIAGNSQAPPAWNNYRYDGALPSYGWQALADWLAPGRSRGQGNTVDRAPVPGESVYKDR